MGERAQLTKPPRAVLLKKERWLKKRRSELVHMSFVVVSVSYPALNLM